MSNINKVEQASREDISEISSFLDTAALIHRHLDWLSILDRLDSKPFLLLKQHGDIQAIFAAPPELPQVAWLYCFAVKDPSFLDLGLLTLLEAARPMFEASGITLFALGLEDWFNHLLQNNGFLTKQQIVVLAWNHHVPTGFTLRSDLLIRPMIDQDLDEVSRLDAICFEAQWVNTRESLTKAFMQSEHASVAELDGRIIGYEMTTANQYAAHLARLAVLQQYRRSGIGRQMVIEMLRYFSGRGLLQLTVNTQNDNMASLGLYKNLGFEPTGESYPVLQLQNSPRQ